MEPPIMQKFIVYLIEKMDILHHKNDYIDEVACSNCSEFLHQPVTAVCGHSFCKKCSSTSATCRYCQTVVPKSAFSKMNVVLSAVIEHYFPHKYLYFALISEGDNLTDKNLFQEALKKYSEASRLGFCDSYSFKKLAMAHSSSGQLQLALADVISAKFRNKENSARFFSKENFAMTVEQEKQTAQQAVETISREVENRENKYLVDYEHSKTANKSRTKVLSELEDILIGIVESNISELESKINTPVYSFDEDLNMRDFEDDCETTETIFSCALCTRSYYKPICTPCGHTFCSECLERSLDFRPVCPMCQSSLKDMYQYQKCVISTDWSLHSIFKNRLPILYQKRKRCELEAAESYRNVLPLFVCTVVLPSVTTKLQVFEPHYRLMLRRVMEFNDGKFGIVGHSPEEQYSKIGTILKIRNKTPLANGSSIITCVGTTRFQVMESGKCDGYFTATKIKVIVDEEEGNSEFDSETKNIANSVYTRARAWYECKPQNFKRTVEEQCGKFPEQDHGKGENGPDWMWWVHSVLPSDNEAKLFVLRQTKVRERLSTLHYIIKRAEST